MSLIYYKISPELFKNSTKSLISITTKVYKANLPIFILYPKDSITHLHYAHSYTMYNITFVPFPYYNQIMQVQMQQIICPICMSIFRRPATLPCGHTFCFACLLNATKENQNCPMCRQTFPSTPAKLRTDHTISTFIQSLRKWQTPHHSTNGSPQNIHVECKEQRLLLVDILTEDLLLPYNRIIATFELQSKVLIDRMQRFVARQPPPFDKYGVVGRLVHIEQIRRHLYRGVIEGKGFSKISSEGVEAQVSLEPDQEQFFYRSCRCKEISQSSDSNPAEYSIFFTYFNRISSSQLKTQIFHRIDPSILSKKTDPIGLFYSILGILNMHNQTKYELAVSFDQERRVEQIKKFIKNNERRFERDAGRMIKIIGQGPTADKKVFFVVLFIVFLYWLSKEHNYGAGEL